jgi:hypothetical protein
VLIPFVVLPVPGAHPPAEPAEGAQLDVPSGAGVAPGVVFVGVRFGLVLAGPVTGLAAPVAELMPGVVLIAGLVEELIPGVVPVVPPVAGTPDVLPAAAEPVAVCASAAKAAAPARQTAAVTARNLTDVFIDTLPCRVRKNSSDLHALTF